MMRTRIILAGESGSGLLSMGTIFLKGLHRLSFFIASDREYPSLIKGGSSCLTINISHEPLSSVFQRTDILVTIDKTGLKNYISRLEDGGILVTGYDKGLGVQQIFDEAQKRNIRIISLPARALSEKHGGSYHMDNMVVLGMIWKVLGFDYEIIHDLLKEKFSSKPKLLTLDLLIAKDAYDTVKTLTHVELPEKSSGTLLLSGNLSLSLGALHAGVRAYFSYPMTPASSILTFLAEMGPKVGMVVKQAEDEITAVQMALGASSMGTRALVATSGGGYDLMTESISQAGMAEIPLVAIISQRPGPATGLPTWTAQGDLNLAMYSSHGEFPRIVVGISDPYDAFSLIQDALNMADLYQCPVIVLSEKDISEGEMTVPTFEQKTLPIERGLIEENILDNKRYKITDSGVSPRWIPGASEHYYYANSDEHDETGISIEDEASVQTIYDKRLRKMQTIMKVIPEPKVYGPTKADISLVCWGGVKKVMLDVINIYKDKNISVNFLHFSYVYPLKTATLKKFFQENNNVHLAELNAFGQLGKLIEQEGLAFKGKLLKYNGRAFFLEDVISYIDSHSK